MNNEIIKLAREYTQETASLRDYQCILRSALFGRQKAQRYLKECEELGDEPYYLCDYSCAASIAKESHVEIEQGDPSDETYYYWAFVPEYNSHNQAKVVLRRIATADGVIILPPEKRAEKRLKISNREQTILQSRSLKTILPKLRNYEAQIKTERSRLAEQLRNNDKAYMEACAIQLKRICDKMQEDLDDFLDMLNPYGV